MAGRRAAAFQNADPTYELPVTPPQEMVRAEFARRFSRAVIEKGWNQSEFARQTVPHTPKSAKGITRDLVSKYIGAKVLPSPVNLQIICDTLGVKREDLLPAGAVPEARDSLPRMSVRDLGDGNVWLAVNQVVPFETSLQILALLKKRGT